MGVAVYTQIVDSGRPALSMSLCGKGARSRLVIFATTAWLPGVGLLVHAPAPRLRFFSDGTVGASEGDLCAS
jgi:hypothetical protein